jgi:rubrerythrin
MSSPILARTGSRRAFLAVLGAGAAAPLAAGCGSATRSSRRPASDRPRELTVLDRAVRLEYTLQAAYREGEHLLHGRTATLIRRFIEQEHAHADRLQRLIRELGGRPSRPLLRQEYLRSFPALRRERDVLLFAADLEELAVRSYVQALRQLADPGLRRVAGSIATSEAEHLAVVRGGLGQEQAPAAFVTGVS